ncbi:MAG: phage portal protein, partial [Nanobdellota archaeon]
MLKQLKNRIKNFWGGDSLFSSISPLPMTKYNKQYSGQDYLNAYEISLYLNRALDKRAEKVAELEFQLKRGEQIIDNHQIIDLLYNPNKLMSGSQFWKLYQKHKDIFGCVYVLLSKENVMGGRQRVNSLHLLRPDKVKPYFDKETGELLKIDHNTAEGTDTYTNEEIIYDYNPSPASPLMPESMLKAGMKQINAGAQIDEYQSRVLE